MSTFNFNDVKEFNPNRFADSPQGMQYLFSERVEVEFRALQNKLDGCAREEMVEKNCKKNIRQKKDIL